MDARAVVDKLLGEGIPDEGIPDLAHYASSNCSELYVRPELLSINIWRQPDSGNIYRSGFLFPKTEFSRAAVAAEKAFGSIRRQSKLDWNTLFGSIKMTTLDQVIVMVRQKLEQQFPWPLRDREFR